MSVRPWLAPWQGSAFKPERERLFPSVPAGGRRQRTHHRNSRPSPSFRRSTGKIMIPDDKAPITPILSHRGFPRDNLLVRADRLLAGATRTRTASMIPQRRHYGLDWLRIGAFGLLIVYHVAMVFSTWDWVIKSPVTYHELTSRRPLRRGTRSAGRKRRS